MSARDAVPGTGTATFLCFAYGSNLSRRRLAARTPSAVPVCTGYVTGRQLAFDKRGSDGSGKCDCESTGIEADRVYGVIFEIAISEKPMLDRAEGLGHGYCEEPLQVRCAGGIRDAVAYIATDKEPGLPVYDWYLQHVLTGAREAGLPADYIGRIAGVRVVRDPDEARAGRELAIYAAR